MELPDTPRDSHDGAPRAWRVLARHALFAVSLCLPVVATAFGFADVDSKAAGLASRAYSAADAPLPDALRQLSYDDYRDIRFRPERALWRGDGQKFELMFFHRGKFATDPVRLNQVVDGRASPIAFDPADYDYGRNRVHPEQWGGLGHAGFRVHYPLNSPAYKDELVVFLGASYFRALGSGQHYGLSARALAIDTVGAPAGRSEEFPRFTEFWIGRPALPGEPLRIHALLESPRSTGAFEFVFKPGVTTVVEVHGRVYLRVGTQAPATLGIAPLTSMFQHGENQPRADDFRPEVHDSDGLSVATGNGEWLWRPLANPARPFTTSFAVRSPQGFGLMQRDRSFSSYEDAEARYDKRPSGWVEPIGDWGAGRVELVSLPTPDETNDNIVAYWVPAQLPAAGQALDFRYRLHWQGDTWQRPPNGWTAQTRAGRSFAAPVAGEQQFTVDFAGPALAALPAEASAQPVVSADANGEVLEARAYRLPADIQPASGDGASRWRMNLRIRHRDPAKPVELRGFLQYQQHALTETWTHVIQAR